jgi:hypothetical protein
MVTKFAVYNVILHFESNLPAFGFSSDVEAPLVFIHGIFQSLEMRGVGRRIENELNLHIDVGLNHSETFIIARDEIAPNRMLIFDTITFGGADTKLS